MILKADPPMAYYSSTYDKLDSVEIGQIKQFVKETKQYIIWNFIGFAIVLIAAIVLWLTSTALVGTIFLLAYSVPLIIVGTAINWKRMNKAKKKLRGLN